MSDQEQLITVTLDRQDLLVILDDLKAAEQRRQRTDAVVALIYDIDVVRERRYYAEQRLDLIERLDGLL